MKLFRKTRQVLSAAAGGGKVVESALSDNSIMVEEHCGEQQLPSLTP